MWIKNAHKKNEISGWLAKYKKKLGCSDNAELDCCVLGCGETADDGAHVWKCDANGTQTDKALYIVPMCHEHNLQYGKHFDTKAGTKAVPVSEL